MSSITVRTHPAAVKALPFAQLPHDLAADPRLTPVDVRVLAALLFWARARAACWPCDRSIGTRVGRSVPVVQRALRRLQGLGIIDREKVEPSDANRTGRIIRLNWRSGGRSRTIEGGRSRTIDEASPEKERERERPSSDEGSGTPRPPAGKGEENDPAELRRIAEGGGPFAAVARKRLAEMEPPPSPAPAEGHSRLLTITHDPAISTQNPRETPGGDKPLPRQDIPISTQAREGGATQVRGPSGPSPIVGGTAQVPGGGAPTMRKPPSPRWRVGGVAYQFGEAISWPLNCLAVGPAPPRPPASP